ncbi:MAG: YkvA family protein [Candidatus Promineifilaceae bacterium]
MSDKPSLNNKQFGILGELWQSAKLTVQLFLDPKVPVYLKALPLAAVAYLLFPVDFLPDVIPGLGQLDDITILLLGAKAFIELAPQDLVAQYRGLMRAEKAEDLAADGQAEKSEGDDIIEGIIIDDDESIDAEA